MNDSQSESLADSASKLEPFINQIADYALYMLDTSGHILSWNAGGERLMGYTAQEVLGRSVSMFCTPEDVAMCKPYRGLEIAAAEGTCQQDGLRVRKDGTAFWATVTITALRDRSGTLLGFAKLTRDITEQRTLQDELRTFKFFSDQSCEGNFIADKEGRIHYVNRRFCQTLGYSEEQALRLRVQDIGPAATDFGFWDIVERTRDGSMRPFESSRRRKDGSIFPVEISATAIEVNGEWLTLVVFRDIAERKRAEQQLQASELRFHSTFEQLAVGLAHVSLDGSLLRVNAKFASIVGHDRETLEHMTFREITHPDDLEKDLHNFNSLLAGAIDGYTMEKRYIRQDKSVIWCNLTVSLVRTATGEPDYLVGVAEDIQARKEAEQALRESEEKFRATFEHAPLGIAECTLDGSIVEANAKLVEMLGYTKDEFTHLTVKDLTHPSEQELSLSNFQKLAEGEADAFVMEKRYVRKDRSLVWVNVTASLTPIPGKPQFLVVTVEDITARKKTEEDLKRSMEASYHQANHDMLTDLANRASFHDRLKEALAYAHRDGHLVAIHLLDLDRFKSINDTLGHHIGDLLLKEVAKRIKSLVRVTDLVARLGGDEFVVIQPQLMEPAAAGILAGKLVEVLGYPYVLEGQEVHSGTSIGIAVWPDDADDPEALIKRADLALYDAKNRGRFNYQFYRQELGAAFLKAQQMEQELVRALRENQFCLHYQPQFALKYGRRMSGIEVLLRWRHPARGLLAATEFLQDAEHAKLMLPIGEWTLRIACRQHKAWVDQGLSVPLTLNLSASQLRDSRLLETLMRVLEETGLPASMLQLEMRETTLLDPKFSNSLLRQMKERGLRLAVDDFGAEITTLPSLEKFPIDVIKPGHKLVKGLPSHASEAALLTAIIDVAHHLNIAVCAEGVETDAQFAAVKEQGCDSAQGNWLSSPLDATEMKRLIDAELAH